MSPIYLKYLKASDVEDADEVLPGQLCVELFVNPGHHPEEQSFIDSFREGTR